MNNKNRDSKGTFLPNVIQNPTGIGGFVDNPQNINFGGRKKNEQRFGYWLQFFKDLTLDEFTKYTETKKINDMYVAEAIAYERVKRARKDLNEYKDLADRTEGRALQTTNISGDLRLATLLGELTSEDISQETTKDN